MFCFFSIYLIVMLGENRENIRKRTNLPLDIAENNKFERGCREIEFGKIYLSLDMVKIEREFINKQIKNPTED